MVPVEVREDDEVDVVQAQSPVGEQMVKRPDVLDIIEILSGMPEPFGAGGFDVIPILGGRATNVDQDVHPAFLVLKQPRDVWQVYFFAEIVEEGKTAFLALRTVCHDEGRNRERH